MSEASGEVRTQIYYVKQSPLQSQGDCDMILVSRKELETEERQLLSRLQLLRRLLGKSPLPTGKQRRLARAAE